MADLDNGLMDARMRHGSAVTAQADASEAEVRARDAASVASASLAELRSHEDEIETLGRKVDEMGRHKQVLVDSAPGLGKKGGVGRSYADAPEIDGVVRLLPPEKISKTLKVGEFTRARIVGTQGHDLVALPI